MVLKELIRWDVFQLFLLTLIISSWVAMACHVYDSKKQDSEPLRDFFDKYSVFDYIGHTRTETGSIGTWFWVFTFSSGLLFAVGIHCLCSDYYAGCGIKFDGDYLWPIL
jgi:hypothetical protein